MEDGEEERRGGGWGRCMDEKIQNKKPTGAEEEEEEKPSRFIFLNLRARAAELGRTDQKSATTLNMNCAGRVSTSDFLLQQQRRRFNKSRGRPAGAPRGPAPTPTPPVVPPSPSENTKI